MFKAITRDSRFEILKILSMILIVTYHFSIQFWKDGSVFTTSLSIEHIEALLCGVWGQLGVNCFVIISAWFLRFQKFKIQKVIYIVLQSFFMGVISVALVKASGISLTIVQTVTQLLAVFFNTYWFITAYLIMYVCSPILNYLIDNISFDNFRRIVVIIGMLVLPWKTIWASAPISDAAYFLYIYLLVSYLKICPNNIFKRKCAMIFVVFTVGICVINLCIYFFALKINANELLKYSYYICHRGSVFILIDSVALFYLFATLKRFSSNTVNIIASQTLSVYLLHQGLLSLFWRKFVSEKLSTFPYIIAMLICTTIIFVFSVLCGFITDNVFDLTTQKIMKANIWERINRYMNISD